MMAGSTRGSKTEMRSCEREEVTDDQQRCMGSQILPHPHIFIAIWHREQILEQFFILDHRYVYFSAYVYIEQMVPVGQRGHT